MKIRNKQQWIKQLSNTLPKIRWFVVQHFGESVYLQLTQLQILCDAVGALRLLNQIWADLPDNTFNIRVNPEGWSEFINLVEMYSAEEAEGIFGNEIKAQVGKSCEGYDCFEVAPPFKNLKEVEDVKIIIKHAGQHYSVTPNLSVCTEQEACEMRKKILAFILENHFVVTPSMEQAACLH